MSSINDEVQFFVPLKKGSINGSLLPGLSESHDALVEARKLSDFVKNIKIDFVKIVAVIQDLVNHDSLMSIDELVVEYHQKVSSIRLNEFLAYFTNLKFAYRVVGEDADRNVILHFYQESGLLK